MTKFYIPPFQDMSLWQQAITHKSYAKEHELEGPDNERLEFLGDAILTFISGEYLFQRYPNRPEGELTPLRAALVDEDQLSHFAKELDLQKHLRLSLGAENSGGRTSDRLLCSAFEAMVGAYFLDNNNDIQAVRDYVWPLFDAVADKVSKTALQVNFKSRLQTWALEHVGVVPQYDIIHESGPDHAKEFTAAVRIQGKVFGQGTGRKKQEAEKQAAQVALKSVMGKGQKA